MPGQPEEVNLRYNFIRDEVSRLELKYSMPVDIAAPLPATINVTGWVYILSNPYMPGILKIGMTTTSPEKRAKELSSGTNVPAAFVIESSFFSSDPRGDECRIHNELKDCRVNDSREFFQCDLALAIDVCRGHCLCDSSTTFSEVANEFEAICIDKDVRVNLTDWFEEFDINYIGSPANIAKAIFDMGCDRLNEMVRDGLSIVIEYGQVSAVMSENKQSHLSYLEECHERETISGVFGPREQAGF